MSISEHRRLIERGAFDLLLKEVDIMRGSVPHGDRSVPVVWEQASWLTFRTSLENIDGIETINPNRISHFTEILYKLEGLVPLLGLLHRTAEDLLVQTHQSVDCVFHGIGRSLQNLPDDLLMRTISFTCSSQSLSDIVKDLLSLSHINKRFRNLALGMADMWAVISPDILAASKLSEAVFERGKSARLYVHIAPHEELLLDKVLPLTHRWKDLRFLDLFATPGEGGAPESWSRCVGLDLPNLEYLEYYGNPSENTPRTDRVYSSWRAPKLREVYFNDVMPMPFLNSTITVVSVNTGWKERDSLVRDFSDLHSFLASTTTIETLSLVTAHETPDYRHSIQNPMPVEFARLVMPNLQTVDLLFKEIYRKPKSEETTYEESPLSLFMHALHTPNLQNFKLHVEFLLAGRDLHDLYDVSSMLFSFVPAPFQCSPIQNLDVRICGDISSFGDLSCNSFISFPFERFPGLRSLSVHIAGILGAPRLLPDDFATTRTFPALEHIVMSKCWGGALPFLRNVIENVRRLNGQHRRVTASIDNCAYVGKEEVLEFIAERDLIFRECHWTEDVRDPTANFGYIPHPSRLPALLSTIGYRG